MSYAKSMLSFKEFQPIHAYQGYAYKKGVYFYLEEFACKKKEDRFINILSHMQYKKKKFDSINVTEH